MEFKRNKVVRAALGILLIIFAFCTVCVERSFASVSQVERPEEELLIFETYVNDELRNLGMLAYLPDGANEEDALLPINAVARALSVSFTVEPVAGEVNGWIFEESNLIQIDLERGVVLLNGRERSLSEGDAESHYDDIYVRASTLQEWLGIKFRPDISTLKLFVSSERKLPFEEEAERRKRAENLPEAGSVSAKGATAKLLPYQWWSKPSIVWQQNLNARSVRGDKDIDTGFSLQSNNDVGKFGTRFLLSGTAGTDDNSTKISNATLTFDRRDPSNNLLGVMKAGKIAVGDVDYPDVPLMTGRKRGRGISVSSDSDFNISRSYGAEKFDVTGDAPIGWDAELYRNGYFVAFQEIGSDGRYNFEQTDLVRGYNLMRVVLYGPEGQKRTETHRIIRGQDMLPEGKIDYEFAVGQPEADFIPLAENARTSSSLGASGHIAYGVKNYLTVGASVYSGDDAAGISNERETSASVSAVAALGPVKVTGQVMRANEGRSGYSVDATTRVLDANITASHTVYEGFHEDDKDLTESTSVDLNRNFGLFSSTIRAQKSAYQRKDDELTLEGTISTRIKGVQLTNSVDRTISDNAAQEDFTGELSLVKNFRDWRLRSNLQYDLERGERDRLRNTSLSAYRRIGRDSTVRINGSYDFITNRVAADARYTKDFEKYAVDFTLGGTNESTYFGGVTFRTGLQPDDNGRYRIVSARDGGLGSVGLRAYVDQNDNGIYDDGERLLRGVGFRSNRGRLDGVTDESGALFVNGLPESPTVFMLDKETLPSIYLKPATDSLEIIPRVGATLKLDMAFEQLGEIDGFVMFSGGDDKPASGVELVLYDDTTNQEIMSAYSEYDGYYIFSAVPMGAYRIEALPLWDSMQDNPFINVALSMDDPIATDRNLEISNPQSIEAAVGVEDVQSDIFLHLSSMSSQGAAIEEQQLLWKKYDAVIGDLVPIIRTIEVNGKVFYRVLGALNSVEQGHNLCAKLTPLHPEGGCAVLEL